MKCCQNGELSDRRRALPAMRYPHPLRHIGDPPLCSNDTQLKFAEPICTKYHSPNAFSAYGDFLWADGGSLFTKGGYFLCKKNQKQQ